MATTELDLAGAPFETVYQSLTKVRAEAPLQYSEEHGGWVVTKYDDIAAILKSPRFTVEGILKAAQNGAYCPEADAILRTGVNWNETSHIQSGDGPEHARFRKAISNVLSPRRLREMQLVVDGLVTRLIDDFITAGECEFVADFCYKLSMLTTLALIGFKEGEDDMTHFPKWVDDTFRFILTPLTDDEQITAARNAVEFQTYVRDKILQRRADLKDDLLSDILRELSSGSASFSDDELVIMFTQSFVGAGHETTKLALANSVFHLLNHRDRWEDLLAHKQDVAKFSEESLRFDPPIFAWFRYCTQDTDLRGQTIKAGDKVVLLLGSANHDDAKFKDSDGFCPFREEKTAHMTFSNGRHFCLGAPLARIEINSALTQLATRIPSLRLKPGHAIEYAQNFGNRAILKLYLEWDVA